MLGDVPAGDGVDKRPGAVFTAPFFGGFYE